jgi:hypothetical protein
MALQFKKYESTANLTELGTVSSFIPNGSLKFVPGTIDRYKLGTIKAMAMILINKDGDSTSVPLSKKVSAVIKKALDNGSPKRDVLAAIAKLDILENEDGVNTISAPRSATGEEETFEIGVKGANVSKVKATYEDLVQW